MSSFDKVWVSSVFVGVIKVNYRLSACSSCHFVIDHHNEPSLQTTIMHIDHHPSSSLHIITRPWHHHHQHFSITQHIITQALISPYHNSSVLIFIIYRHRHQYQPSYVTFTHICIFIYGGITQ